MVVHELEPSGYSIVKELCYRCRGICQLGLKGIVVGQGDTYEQALSDVKSAIRFHVETFGPEVLEMDPPILEAFVAEAGVEL